MPPRYQQGQLASPVVGTPGVDPSAGAVEADIAKTAANAQQIQSQSAMQQLKGAEADFASANSQFINILQRQAYDKKVALAAQKKLQVDMEAALLQPALQKQVDDALLQAKTTYANTPYDAAGRWNKEVVPELQRSWTQQYGSNPSLLKEVLQSGASKIASGTNELQSWAPQVINAKIEGGLAKIPALMSDQIGSINSNAPMVEQLNQFRKIFDTHIAAYDALRRQAEMMPAGLAEGKIADIDSKAINLKSKVSKEFIENGLAGLSANEAGYAQVKDWKLIAQNPEGFGLRLNGDDKNALTNAAEAAERDIVTGVTEKYNTEAAIGSIDAQVAKSNLAENFNNPVMRARIMSQLTGAVNTLQDKIAAAKAEPESPIKQAKLLAYKQQLGAFVGAENADLSQTLKFEGIQRSLVTFANSITRFGQSQVTFQQGQEAFAGRVLKADAVKEFNTQWQAAIGANIGIMGMPPGPQKKAAADAQAARMMEINNRSFGSGAIDAKQFDDNADQAKSLLINSEYRHSDGFFGLGADDRAPVTSAGKAKAVQDAAVRLAAVAGNSEASMRVIQNASSLVEQASRDPEEIAAAQRWFNTNGAKKIQAWQSQGVTMEQINEKSPAWVHDVLLRYRAGTLK